MSKKKIKIKKKPPKQPTHNNPKLLIFLSSVKLTDGSSSSMAAIYLSFMERVADEFSHSWTAASQLSLTQKLDWHWGLKWKDTVIDLLLYPQSFPTEIWRVCSRYWKKNC